MIDRSDDSREERALAAGGPLAPGGGVGARRGGATDAERLFARLREALEIALNSGVEDVARAAYARAEATHARLVDLELPERIQARLDGFVEDMRGRFPTAWRINAALAELELASAAGAADARRAHLEAARDVLAGGLEDPSADHDEIGGALAQVEEALAGSAEGPVEVEVERFEAPELDVDVPAGPAGAGPSLSLEVEVAPRVHAADVTRRRGGAVHRIAVRNAGEDAITGLTLALRATPAIALPSTVDLPPVEAGATIELGPRRVASFLRPDPGAFEGLSEPVDGALVAELTDASGAVVASASADWRVLPIDTWPGLSAPAEGLAAFVLPNDDGATAFLREAGEALEAATGASSLDGYQSGDPRRALRVVEAVFSALAGADLTYANPPASFERDGQRVRFPASVAGNRLATCLDLALVAAAVLEAAGLHPLVVLVEGHAFAACWLVERTFPAPSVDDVGRVRGRIELTELVAFDPTVATRGGASFSGARDAAAERLADPGALFVAVDVRRARLGGVLPLSTARGGGADPSGLDARTRAEDPSRDLDAEVAEYLAAERRRALERETPDTRLDRWLRQLLDLSMRNRLLNAGRSTKKVLPLYSASPGAIEDRLADGGSLRVAPRPAELAGVANPTPEELSAVQPLFQAGAGRGELFAPFDEGPLAERLLFLYREARTAREEGGSSGLYLAIGTLVYFETHSSETERRAPLLLLPLDLSRESARSGFSFSLGADEPRVNVTLLEALRRDHDIDVVGLDPLPTDDSGVDVDLVLRLVRDAVKDEGRWRVEESLSVGLFSFSKYLLWRDLKERSDDLRRSALVQHLIDTPGQPFAATSATPPVERLDAEVGASEVFAPMSYDSTQLSAILAAAAGSTMVLEGPPGTGKSQTITNLIAHAVASGQTVLFVSEKTAALEVVHRRLVGLGLGPACLELHSAKSSKKAVLAQFEEALEAGRQRGKRRRDWDEVCAEIGEARAALNAHVEALHRRRTSGSTLHEVLAELARPDAALAPLEVDVGDPLALSAERLAAWRAALSDLDVHGAEHDVSPDHPLLLVGQTETSPLFERSSREDLASFDEPCARFMAASAAALEALGGDPEAASGAEEAWRALADLLARLAADAAAFEGDAARDWLADPARLDAVEALVGQAEELRALRAESGARFRVQPESLDLDALERTRREYVAGGFIKRWLRGRALRAAFRGIANAPLSTDEAIRALDAALRARELDAETAAPGEDARSVLGGAWTAASVDVARDRERISLARALAASVDAFGRATGMAPRVVAGVVAPLVVGDRAAPADLAERAVALRESIDGYASALERVRAAARPTERAPDPWSPGGVDDWRGLVRRWLDGWSRQRGWTRWAQARAKALEVGLADVVELVETGAAEPGALRPRFERRLAEDLALHEISADDRLKAFEGVEHERAVERYRALDDERLDVAREEAIQRVAGRRPTRAEQRAEAPPKRASDARGLGLLQREIAKKSRHVATRRLLGSLGEDAMRLKPCFLMSPMSVAQYLEADHPPFDLVVFDEASQIPVWDAVGAIARGRQAVVVGDPKQLPPTSFFARGADDDEAQEDEVEDLESILDECIAAGVPVRRLSWHYRSRDESLIAFSNERYYGGDLVTFPSAARAGGGVSARYVEDGVYDKGRTRTNRAEAEAVVAEVVERLERDGATGSIGVVTFNQAQQTLVLDLFDAALRERPHLDRFFAEGAEEGVFVKNLENVQGDERDVIVFSIGYGPDADGRVSMNFGPLNKDGGERRLNVAVTRARREVLVFTSLRSDQIDLGRTSARGVADLRAFLRHAERGAAGVDAADDDWRPPQRDPLVQAIADALRERGHDVRVDVGRSGVRVDLAVVDPDDPQRFALGIETDGLNYARAATARDRDRLRPLVLGGLGWRLHRMWAVDWWRDPEGQLAAIEAALGRGAGGEA